MRLVFVLTIGIVAGVLFSNGALAGLSLGSLAPLLPLGLRGTAIAAFGLTMSVLTLLTLVSQGGRRKNELSTAVPAFFGFFAFFFGIVYWLFG